MNKTRTILSIITGILLVGSGVRLSAEIIPLAPEREEFVVVEDFFVTFSLAGYGDAVKRIDLYFDNEDISSDCRVTGTTISFIPGRTFSKRPDLAGPHTVTVLIYGLYRTELGKEVLRFYLCENDDVSDEEKLAMIEKGKKLRGVTPVAAVHGGKVYTGIHYESYQDSGVFAGIMDASGNGYKGKWFYNYNMSLTTQEDTRRQTLQRFRFATGYTRSLQLSLGDNWPSYNPYVLDGQCLRGFEINLKTPKRYVNLDFAYGMVRREIDPYLSDKKGLNAAIDSTAAGLGHNDSIAFFEDGTYQRRILAARLHFGTGKVFKLGFDFLKAKDDSASIDQLYTVDTAGNITIKGETPKDNVVAGADICFNFLKRRISLFSTYALSFYTDNILGGYATEEEISDAAGKEVNLAIQPKDIKKILIVNETTVPIPIPSDSTRQVNMGSVMNATSWDAGFRINLPFARVQQLFTCKYFFAGPNFTSLGNEYLSVNKAGVQFVEELRLFNGKIFLRGDVKVYKDDLHDVKNDPTRKISFNCLATVMWNSTVPYITFLVVSADEKTLGSRDTLVPRRENKYNQIGTTIQYTRGFNRSAHTFALTYNYNNYDSKIFSNSILNRYELRGNNAILSVSSRYDDLPIQTRGSLSGFLSKGNYSVNRIAPGVGVTWYIKPDKMSANADFGFERIDDEAHEANNYWSVKSSFTYDISSRHSLYAEAGLERDIQADYIDPRMQVRYEFRY